MRTHLHCCKNVAVNLLLVYKYCLPMFYCVILTISWCEVRGGAAPQWELAIAPGPDQHNLELDKYFCQSVYFKEINFRLCLSVSENKLVAPLESPHRLNRSLAECLDNVKSARSRTLIGTVHNGKHCSCKAEK